MVTHKTLDEADLVLAANQLFHDLEAEAYDNRHPEIFKSQPSRLLRHLSPHLAGERTPVRLADIGSGTGFVPLTLSPFLSEEDEIVCSDLSAGMLENCRGNIEQNGVAGRFSYAHLDGRSLSAMGTGFDVVTLNSVLHHIPDPDSFLRECSGLLNEGGKLIISHEPNIRFLRNPLAMACRRVVRTSDRAKHKLKRLVASVSRGKQRSGGAVRDEHSDRIAKVAEKLLASGRTNRLLDRSEVEQLIDHSSPTAGGQLRQCGFDVEQLAETSLKGFSILSLETYRPLSWEGDGSWLGRAFARVLATLFPKDGATFICVLGKDAEYPRKPLARSSDLAA